ncbi:hypothetical protein D3C81_1839980 [compost metagenome]
MLGQALAHGGGVFAHLVLNQIAHDGGTGGHRHLVAAESPGVGARQPGVQPVAVDHHRQRQAAADGFGHHHHIGGDPGVFEGKHLAGAGESALDLVDDQRHPCLFGDPAQTA